ncbi:MAG: PIN domain-containing protein [Nostoc sp.]|uniref:type II toxin-antitoxin system VapC family toxin n=1 Tax=Nostoc sp. TaxID=1180 RepID=UPI002FFBDFB0
MKILLDTNIIVDDAFEREPFLEASEQVLVLVEQGQVEGYISASTFAVGQLLPCRYCRQYHNQHGTKPQL